MIILNNSLFRIFSSTRQKKEEERWTKKIAANVKSMYYHKMIRITIKMIFIAHTAKKPPEKNTKIDFSLLFTIRLIFFSVMGLFGQKSISHEYFLNCLF